MENPFSALSVEENNQATIDRENNEVTNHQPITKVEKIKPISIARTSNYLEILKEIEANHTENFHVRTGSEFVRIHPDTGNDHRIISRFIRDNNVEGFILPIEPPKFFKVDLRRLPVDTPEELIKSELIAKGYPVVAVKQIVSQRTGLKKPLFTIELQADTTNTPNIWDLKKLCFEKITVEKWIPPRKVRQCHRCQHFHHSSSNCTMKPRSVKCSESHLTNECPHGQGKIAPELTKCCNCGKSHPASYQGCEKYPTKKSPVHFSKFNPSNINKLQPGISYANRARGPTNEDPQGPNQNRSPTLAHPAPSPANSFTPTPPPTTSPPIPNLNLELIAQVKELVSISNEITRILGTTDLTTYITAFKTLQNLLTANGDGVLGLLSSTIISSSG
jgi:hypothetical protein